VPTLDNGSRFFLYFADLTPLDGPQPDVPAPSTASPPASTVAAPVPVLRDELAEVNKFVAEMASRHDVSHARGGGGQRGARRARDDEFGYRRSRDDWTGSADYRDEPEDQLGYDLAAAF
jgi:hypothetical protein